MATKKTTTKKATDKRSVRKEPKIVRYLLINDHHSRSDRVRESNVKNIDKNIQKFIDSSDCGCEDEDLVVLAVYNNGTVKDVPVVWGPKLDPTVAPKNVELIGFKNT